MIPFYIVSRCCILCNYHSPWYKIWLTSVGSGPVQAPLKSLSDFKNSQSWLYERVMCLSVIVWCLVCPFEWRLTAKSYTLQKSGQSRQRAWLLVAVLFSLRSAVTSALALWGRQMGPAMLPCDFLSNLLKNWWKNKLLRPKLSVSISCPHSVLLQKELKTFLTHEVLLLLFHL